MRPLLLLICVIWGLTIVVDSAQFSATVAELAGADRVGTMLTLQTALGFLLTLVSIHLMPVFVDLLGWRYAFVPLALGPLAGIWARARLRRSPGSTAAGGRARSERTALGPRDGGRRRWQRSARRRERGRFRNGRAPGSAPPSPRRQDASARSRRA